MYVSTVITIRKFENSFATLFATKMKKIQIIQDKREIYLYTIIHFIRIIKYIEFKNKLENRSFVIFCFSNL